MSAYKKRRISTYPKKYVNIPQRKGVNLPFKYNIQSSVYVKVPRNKVSNRLLVKYHISTNDKDVSIQKKKNVDIPPKNMSTYLNVKM